MKTLYNAISKRITDNIPAIKMVDFDMGQLELLASDVRPPVKFPCALLDIAYQQAVDETETIQQVTARVSIRLAFETPLPTDSLAGASRRNKSLEIIDTVEDVYEMLQGFSDGNFNPLSRVNMTPDNRFAGIKIITTVFQTNFLDYSAVPVPPAEPEPPEGD